MLSIKNFGHYWSRDLIDWGTTGRGNAGALLGATKPGAKEYDTDFRDQVCIYVLFDENRQVIYVGQTGSGNKRLLSRLRDHSRGPMRDRWHNFSWLGFLEPDDNGILQASNKSDASVEDSLKSDVEGAFSDALNEIEAVLLLIEEPALNKQGPRWAGSKEYFQYDPFDPEPDRSELMEKLQEIQEQLAELQ